MCYVGRSSYVEQQDCTCGIGTDEHMEYMYAYLRAYMSDEMSSADKISILRA